MNKDILNGMAKAFFASSWADLAEETGNSSILCGAEIMDIMPADIDPGAIRAAERLYCNFEKAFNDFHGEGDTLDGAYIWLHGVESMPGETETKQAENFGHYAAMQAMGHGVGLWEYVPHQISDHVPNQEFSYFDLENEYFEVSDDE